MNISRRAFVIAAAGTLAAPAIIGRARAANVLRIAHPAPLTGPSGSFGITVRDGSFMAQSEVNDAGGLVDSAGNTYQVEIVVDDVGNDARQAVTMFRRYVDDPTISAVLGPIASTGWVPCVPMAGQFSMPLVGNGSLAMIKQWNIWSYRVNPVSAFTVPTMLKGIIKATNFKRLGVIYDQSNDGQATTAAVAKAVAGDVGYELVDTEAYRAGERDFSIYISKLKAANVDAILIGAQTTEGGPIALQIRNAGLDAIIIAGEGNLVDPVWWDNSQGAINGGYTYLHTDLAVSGGKLHDWLDTYNKRFTLPATAHSIDGYVAAMCVFECVRQAASTDRTKIREAMQNLHYVTPLGNEVTWKNPPHGDNLTPSLEVVHVTGKGTYEKV
jgi:branched-chain amino acid transport system substrate-binding protein